MTKSIIEEKVFTLTLGCNLPDWFIERIRNNEILANQDGTFSLIKENKVDTVLIKLNSTVTLDNKNVINIVS